MRNCTKKLPSYILALLLLFSAYGAQAQTQADFQDKNINVQLSLSTEAPAPGQVVRATVNAFSEDIDAALISWYVNGTRSAQGVGLKEQSFTAGNIGVGTTIRVLVDVGDKSGEDQRTITAGAVSLVWETNLYTPPFYKGKSLHVRNNDLTITAIPNVGVPADSLVYTWSEGGTVLGSKSGFGKQNLTLPGSFVGDAPFVRVDVARTDGTPVGAGSIEIPFSSPSVLVYEYSPTLGIHFERAQVIPFNLENNEVTFQVFPYFFSENKDVLRYKWKLNKRLLSSETGPSLTVRKPESGSGESVLEVSAHNSSEILQSAETVVRIQFD